MGLIDLHLILAAAVVFALLLTSEALWRIRHVPPEVSRKFVHITVGSFVAFWPFFLEWEQITLLSVLFVLAVITSKYLHIFRAIHSVQRPTAGEVFFGLAVGVIAVVTHSKGIYAAAILQMSLADGLAAVVGLRYGLKNQYKVLGSTKSVTGTATFFAVSLALLIGFTVITGASISLLVLIALAAGASLLENLGIRGLDNLFVPLLVAAVLTALVA